jgi:N-acetyl-anhydromuramyl-L-alanine amidase AmpD
MRSNHLTNFYLKRYMLNGVDSSCRLKAYLEKIYYMLLITNGRIVDPKIILKIQALIEKGGMTVINGIVVHQTDTPDAASTFSSYANGKSGAHLLIDKDGTVYQTARLNQSTWHIGKLQSRCVVELKCPKPKTWNPSGTNRAEMAKSWPQRYPSNRDSIGIEIVGLFDKKMNTYESVTSDQNASLGWLIKELQAALKLNTAEVFRHPQVSYKQPSEAATAKW